MAGQGSGSAALLLISIFAAACCTSLAKTIQVAWNQQTDYTTFSSDKNLQSGDIVVFTYTSPHTADVVSEADYNSCTSRPTASVASGTGLTVTKDTYVICSAIGHCGGGMKVALTPTSTPTTPTTPGTTPTTPGTTPTTPGTTPETPSPPTTQTPSTPNGSSASGLKVAAATIVASIAMAPLLL